MADKTACNWNGTAKTLMETQNDRIDVSIGALSGGHLTSQTFTDVFDAFLSNLNRLSHISTEGLLFDLQKVEWIDHLPLLALYMIVEQSVDLELAPLTLVPPLMEEPSAFLERWGFFKLIEEKNVLVSPTQELATYRESVHSRVLPISPLGNLQSAGRVRDVLLKADSALREVLRKDACLTDADTAGLAELVVFELCKNVVEHSGVNSGIAIAHASKPTEQLAHTRNNRAAEWEMSFYDAIGEEGATEIVIGDSGAGIIHRLHTVAARCGIKAPTDVLKYAFEPYSTSKTDSGTHTRGLWCVKEKVRHFGGLLYVRSCTQHVNLRSLISESSANTPFSGPPGVAAFWDFLNHPDQDEPKFVMDHTWFPGTQVQILLPQQNHRAHAIINSEFPSEEECSFIPARLGA